MPEECFLESSNAFDHVRNGHCTLFGQLDTRSVIHSKSRSKTSRSVIEDWSSAPPCQALEQLRTEKEIRSAEGMGYTLAAGAEKRKRRASEYPTITLLTIVSSLSIDDPSGDISLRLTGCMHAIFGSYWLYAGVVNVLPAAGTSVACSYTWKHVVQPLNIHAMTAA